ncbi:unnamed protein product [Rotaria sp. Silwood2]|nr:unnamed protein product [Rotaria sp. Silwood2]
MAIENINNLTNDFVLVWLDSTIETNKNHQNTKVLLQRLIRVRLLTFDDPDQCIDNITDEPLKRIFLIISNTFGKHVIPLIHEFPYIQSIYIYYGDQEKIEAWTMPYSKISGIFIKTQALIHKICDDVKVHDKNGDLSMSMFHLAEKENTLEQLSKESVTFMWYQLILKVLRLMAKYDSSKDEMIAECRTIYDNNAAEQMKINDFEENYSPIKALEWYINGSFVYRLLNKALRAQNIDIIFKFRFFINDLHNQIEQLYHQYLDNHSSIIDHHLTVYRSQHLDMEELDLLKSNVNELISMNSFLSATLNQEIAKLVADTNDQLNESSSLQWVIFIINISNISKEMTPFAFLKNSSCLQDEDQEEEEVLFTMGTIFKIQSVEQHENMWHIHLQLSKEQNELSQSLVDHTMKQSGSELDPLLFGWFLYRMSEFDKAERYAQLMLTQLPSNDKGSGNAYNLLGLIYQNVHRLEKSVECYEKALDIYSLLNCHNSPQVIATHCNLALVYLKLGDIRNAEEQQRQAEEKLINSSQAKNSLLTATVESLKAKIQAEYGDDTSALENLELVLKKKKERLPSDHPSIASTLNEIGIVHEKMNNDVKALEYFQQALEIGKRSLPSDHLDLADYYENIARIYYKCKQFRLALEQYELALNIIEDFSQETERIDKLYHYITDVRKKLLQS